MKTVGVVVGQVDSQWSQFSDAFLHAKVTDPSARSTAIGFIHEPLDEILPLRALEAAATMETLGRRGFELPIAKS